MEKETKTKSAPADKTEGMTFDQIVANGLHPFLKPKKLKIKPISDLKFEGQTISELPQGFMMEHQVYKLDLPIDGKTGQLVKVFDTTTKYLVPGYNEEMTELEFFSREKNMDLATNAKNNNFWKAYTDPTTRDSQRAFTLDIPKNGIVLDLTRVEDCLKAKIAYANTRRIAPNWEDRFDMPTYRFALVDENRAFDNKKELLDKRTKAIQLYATEYVGQENKLRNFIVVHNPLKKLNKATSLATLETYVGELATEKPDEFFNVHKDPFFLLKTKIYKAIEVGYILYATKTTFKTVNDEPLGTIMDIIGKCREDINFLNRIEKEIQDK
jgi:hypothetical protein